MCNCYEYKYTDKCKQVKCSCQTTGVFIPSLHTQQTSNQWWFIGDRMCPEGKRID